MIQARPAALVLAATALTFSLAQQSPAANPASPAAATDQANLRPDLPCRAQASEPVNHEVDFSVVVTPPYHCHVLKVWLPIPQSGAGQDVRESKLSTFPQQVEPRIATEGVYGNKFAYFEFHEPQGAQIIRHQFSAKVSQLNWDVDPNRVTAVTQWPASFAPYLQPQAIDEQQAYDAELAKVIQRPTGRASDLFPVMNWIEQNLAYDHVRASLAADANHAFQLRRGHCSDYHGLCATMGRSLGYPTCVTYGLALFPKNSPSHCKLEAFLPPYGWVSFDLSETQKMIHKIAADEKLSDEQKQQLAAAARQRLRSGFRENSWLLLTRGTNYQLVPQAVAPVSVVRTIYAEADGEVLPEPDPANLEKREYAWMTVHKYQADREFKQPFKDFSTLPE